MTTQAILGIAAGIIELASSATYVVSILRGYTRPDRVTWWILGLVSGIITASYYATGARETIWLPLVYTVNFLVIGILSVRYGYGQRTLSSLDRFALVGTFISAVIWWIFNSPVVALYMNITIDFIALVPTIYKAYRKPRTEGPASWVIGVFASVLNVLAIQEWTFAVSFYPIYLLFVNTAIAYFIVRERAIK